MGYTSYFNQESAFTELEWTLITTAAKAVIAKMPKDMICGGDGTGKPTISKTEIMLNGNESGDQYHETFHITKAKFARFNFCKTARKPYDVVVVAILCVAEHFAPGKLNISSDGNKNEWAAGLQLAQSVIPAVVLPNGIK